MKKDNSRRNNLIEAILSKDKEKLKQAIQKSKPEKWLHVELDHETRTIKLDRKIVTEDELEKTIASLEQEYSVNIFTFNFTMHKEGVNEEWPLPNCLKSDEDTREVTLKI